MYKYEKRTLKEYSVICGSCGARAGWALSREEALQLARDNGWHLGSSDCALIQEGEVLL